MGFPMIESILHDVRYAARSLARQRGVTALAVGILALGLGLNAAVLAVAYGVLWRPLPYPAADRLVTVAQVDLQEGRESAVWRGWPAWSGPRWLKVLRWPRAGWCWASWRPGPVCDCSRPRLPA